MRTSWIIPVSQPPVRDRLANQNMLWSHTDSRPDTHTAPVNENMKILKTSTAKIWKTWSPQKIAVNLYPKIWTVWTVLP